MNSKPISYIALCFAALLGLAAGNMPAQASGPAAVSWRQLVFEAVHPAGQVRVVIDLEPSEASDLRDLTGTQGTLLMPGNAGLQRLTGDINASAMFIDKQWRGQAWFLEDGTALQRSRFKPGEKGDYRLYRYTSEGVARKRFRPEGDQQAALPPEQWGKVKEKFFSFGSSSRGCDKIFDAFALLYPLSAHGLGADPGQGVCVFNKKGLYLVHLEAADSAPISLSLNQGPDNLIQRLDNGVESQGIALRPQPLGALQQEREPFEFMGLEGDIRVYLDPATGLPLRLSGDLGGLGRVELDLTGVDLR